MMAYRYQVPTAGSSLSHSYLAHTRLGASNQFSKKKKRVSKHKSPRVPDPHGVERCYQKILSSLSSQKAVGYARHTSHTSIYEENRSSVIAIASQSFITQEFFNARKNNGDEERNHALNLQSFLTVIQHPKLELSVVSGFDYD